jgi:hypothetical protein
MKIFLALLLTTICLGCGGYSSPSSSSMAPKPGTKPTISALVPNTANAGDPQFMLTVNGTSFAAAAVVNWNGTATSTSRVTNGQLMATIPASAIATAGTVSITVTNPATPGAGGIYGNGGTAAATSNTMSFTVN